MGWVSTRDNQRAFHRSIDSRVLLKDVIMSDTGLQTQADVEVGFFLKGFKRVRW